MVPGPPNRLDAIEGMRGLAAFYVVLQHCCTMVDPLQRLKEPSWLVALMKPLYYGHFAVAAFIVISGYCLQLSLYRRADGRIDDLKRFLERRCWRILPPYYACLGFSLLVCWAVTSRQSGLPWSQYLPVTTENVMAHVFMVHNLSREWMYKINGVLWSISIEFQLYFLFPALVTVLWRWGIGALVAVTSALAGAGLLFLMDGRKLYLWYLPLFALGMVAARLAFKPDQKRPSPVAVWATILLFFGLGIASIGWTKELWIRDSLLGVGVAALLVAVGTQRVPILDSKVLVWLGGFSYSLYLMHHPVMQVLFAHRPEWVATPLRQMAYLFVVGVPLMVGASYAFFRVFEKPFMKGRPKWLPTSSRTP